MTANSQNLSEPVLIGLSVSNQTPAQLIGRYVAACRIHRHISQGELAKAINKSQSQLSRIESGHSEATISELVVIAKFFEMPLRQLIFCAGL